MQPLIDEGLQSGVALHPLGFLGEVERLFRMHRAEHAGVKPLLVSRLRGIRDHQIGVALGDLVEDRDIVIEILISAFLTLPRANRSLVPPVLTITRVSLACPPISLVFSKSLFPCPLRNCVDISR